jgi:hypothetical protein
MEKKLINITRSFSMKKSLGNYEMADFFASQTVECEEGEAEEKSKAIYEWCKKQVLDSINQFPKTITVVGRIEDNYTPKVKHTDRYKSSSPDYIQSDLDPVDIEGNRKV